MVEPAHPGVHHCSCQDCERCPQSTIAEEHRLINQLVATFDEKSRRLYVAFLARQEGRGGLAKLARITGLSRNTIRRGWQELLHPSPDSEGRIRHKGGGRMRLEKKKKKPSRPPPEKCCRKPRQADPIRKQKGRTKSSPKIF